MSAASASQPPADMVVTFQMPLLTVRLSDIGPFGVARTLARLQLRDARVRYTSHDGPSETSLCVRALHVLDELRGGQELLRTVQPEQPAAGQMQELADLKYRSTLPGEPNELHVRFSRLHVDWNPETIAALLAFVRLPANMLLPPPLPPPPGYNSSMTASIYMSATDVDGVANASELPPSMFGGEEVRSEGGDEAGDALCVVAQLESFSVSLNAERTGEKLALLAMKELGVTVRLPPEGGMEISGQLGNLTAQDMLTVPSAPYEMLGLRESAGGSLLTFEYNSPSEEARALARAAGKYDSSAKVRMSSVHVAFWYPAVMRTVHYLMSGVLGALMSATANTVAQMARSVLDAEVSAMALDVEVGSPLVLLPTHAGGSVGLLADLGRITVRNTLVRVRRSNVRLVGGASEVTREATLDKIHITLERMKMDSVGSLSSGGGTAAVAAQMLRDFSFDVTLERGLGLNTDLPLSVRAHGGEIACDVSKQQYDRDAPRGARSPRATRCARMPSRARRLSRSRCSCGATCRARRSSCPCPLATTRRCSAMGSRCVTSIRTSFMCASCTS